MRNLKNRVFYLLIIILTIFLVIIFSIFNFNDYKEGLKKVERSLRVMDDNRKENAKFNNDIGRPMMFMDMTVYTILLNNNDIIDIISHSPDSNVDEIQNIAKDIISNKKSDLYIGNLYFNRYSYSFNNNVLTIIDNTYINHSLLNTARLSIVLFIMLEGVIIFISLKLTSWITTPVEESFNKQKEFVADASHELKTPLAVIMASSEAFERDNNKKWIKNIQTEAERMNSLILSLLDLAKSENNQKKYTLIDLSKIINKSILSFESLIYEKNIKLDSEIEDSIEIIGSNDEIKELMSILIDNAIKHSDKKGEIKINLFSYKNEIELDVINKGNPILKEDEEKIFERFYKVDKSRNRDSNRYGLGLAIAKNIVTNHKGVISAHSKDGYTIFKIVFKK